MTAELTDEIRTITLAISDVPDMDVPFTKNTVISPSWLEIRYQWRRNSGLYFSGVATGGPRRLKSGQLGASVVTAGYISPEQRPSWINELVEQYTPDGWAQ